MGKTSSKNFFFRNLKNVHPDARPFETTLIFLLQFMIRHCARQRNLRAREEGKWTPYWKIQSILGTAARSHDDSLYPHLYRLSFLVGSDDWHSQRTSKSRNRSDIRGWSVIASQILNEGWGALVIENYTQLPTKSTNYQKRETTVEKIQFVSSRKSSSVRRIAYSQNRVSSKFWKLGFFKIQMPTQKLRCCFPSNMDKFVYYKVARR